jgi:hypothetical protein
MSVTVARAATTLTVTNTNDSGGRFLREAIVLSLRPA